MREDLIKILADISDDYDGTVERLEDYINEREVSLKSTLSQVHFHLGYGNIEAAMKIIQKKIFKS